jgi:hypothetical protein
MSFSFRNLFQRDAASEANGHPAASASMTAHSGLAGAKLPGHSMQATLPASPSNSPFQIGGSPLFKTMGNEPAVAPPINSSQGMSPFSINGAAPTNTPLTVGDVIGHLPPEVVRAGALPAEQPLALPPALLENALRSGQAALPVFELYRVCPALFQTPISPQDPRMVPLPAAKLPGLIAQAREGQGNQPSPFSQAQPASPFAAIPAAKPSPFSITPAAEAAPGSPFQAAAPPPSGPVRFPMSPFAAAQSEPPAEAPRPMAAEAAPMASPFASLAGAPQPSVASPFAMSQAAPTSVAPAQPPASPFSFGAGGSPFGVPPQAPFPPAQPAPFLSFGAATAPVPQAAPAPAEQQPTSITGLFTPKQQEPAAAPAPSPFGAPFAAAFKDATPAAPQQNSAPQMPSSPSGMAKLGFAAALSGYSLEELGFNPAMVPAWITTSLPASTLSAQLSSGQVMVELGALVEGLSDVGFRNTLSSAKREAQIRLPQNEVFHALTAATGSAQASGGGVAAAPPPAPVANSFFVQPGAAHGQPSQVEAAPQSMFASQPAAPQQSPAPLFAAAAPTDPGLNQPPSQPFTPKFGASLNPFAPTAAPAPFTPPPAEPAAPQQAVPSLFAPTPTASPAPSLFQTFGAPPAASAFAGQPTAQPTGSLVAAPKPFDPFASTGQLATAKPPTDSGFSSAQLLGQMPPAASQPSANSPFGAPASEFKPQSAFAPKAEEAFVPQQAAQPSKSGLFSTPVPNVPLFSEPKPAPQLKPIEDSKPAPAQPAPAVAPSNKMAAVKHSFLGLSPADTQTDQLLLRALLGTEENLTAPRVVELLASQSGLSACVCLHGSHVLSHADSRKPDASEFQRQAPEIARQLRGLAPLIGIEGAETFTLNAGGRLLTFCFPDNTTVAVLHENEPSNGLRDKITLIARELARMLG